jgi:hypothetical protein
MELIEKFIFFFVLLNSDDAYLFKMRPQTCDLYSYVAIRPILLKTLKIDRIAM